MSAKERKGAKTHCDGFRCFLHKGTKNEAATEILGRSAGIDRITLACMIPHFLTWSSLSRSKSSLNSSATGAFNLSSFFIVTLNACLVFSSTSFWPGGCSVRVYGQKLDESPLMYFSG